MRNRVGSDHSAIGLKAWVAPLALPDADAQVAPPPVRAFRAPDSEGPRHGRRIDQIADIPRRVE